MFAGSILDLEPDTEYEARFVMSDPDGVQGQREKTVTVRTRPEPKPYAGGRVFHVYPHGYQRHQDPARFRGVAVRLLPDVLRNGLGHGVPAPRPAWRHDSGACRALQIRSLHLHQRSFDQHGSVRRNLLSDGQRHGREAHRDQGGGDGEAIFDGNGAFNLFNVKAGNYTYFEGLTIRNTEIAIWAGTQFIEGSKGLTVKHCRFEDIGMGVYTNYSGSKDFYIADNYFIGRNDPKHLIGWTGNFWAQFAGVEGQVFPPKMASYIAVKVYGSGHVMAYNYVANFHDGIDNETYGNPDGSAAIDGPKYPPKEYWDRRPVSIDYYNNYMTNFHDDAFEIDGSMHNVRVMRNMMINNASQPFCNQPALGGPVYWIRNISYNVARRRGAVRRRRGHSVLQQHHLRRGVRRNHVEHAFSEQPDSGAELGRRIWRSRWRRRSPAVFGFTTYTNYSSSDYNGFSPNANAPYSFQWNSPAFSIPPITPAAATTRKSRRGGTRRWRSIRRQPAGCSQPVSRLRHLHERAAAGRARCEDRPEALRRERLRFPTKAGGCRDRPGRRAAERHRRLCRPRSRFGRD